MHNAVTHRTSLTLSPLAAVTPSRNQPLWCCSYHQEEDFRASNPCGWKKNKKKIMSFLAKHNLVSIYFHWLPNQKEGAVRVCWRWTDIWGNFCFGKENLFMTFRMVDVASSYWETTPITSSQGKPFSKNMKININLFGVHPKIRKYIMLWWNIGKVISLPGPVGFLWHKELHPTVEAKCFPERKSRRLKNWWAKT